MISDSICSFVLDESRDARTLQIRGSLLYTSTAKRIIHFLSGFSFEFDGSTNDGGIYWKL
jgi:hypothetical protein